MNEYPKPFFVNKYPMTFQRHSKIVETLILEKFHDGKKWSPSAPQRYLELEEIEHSVATTPRKDCLHLNLMHNGNASDPLECSNCGVKVRVIHWSPNSDLKDWK